MSKAKNIATEMKLENSFPFLVGLTGSKSAEELFLKLFVENRLQWTRGRWKNG